MSGEPSSGPDALSILARIIAEVPPLDLTLGGRLPLYIWPAMGPLDLDGGGLEELVIKLWERGIGYISMWDRDEDHAEQCIAAARVQSRIGAPVAVNATRLVYGVFDGSPGTGHLAADGATYFDETFHGPNPIGCPFTLSSGITRVERRVRDAVDIYVKKDLPLAFVFADWEIDGPMEWNGAWAASRRCLRCRGHIERIGHFPSFQRTVRSMRSSIQRRILARPVLDSFPGALVGNYGVYPHDGYRYWYDYFETGPESDSREIRVRTDGSAVYRPWYHEYPETGYTFGMPVVYPWDDMWYWSISDSPDFRWVRPMLRVAVNAGESARGMVPLVTFVHGGTVVTGKPIHGSPVALSPEAYGGLLRHVLLRGHAGLFVWSPLREAFDESMAAYTVYRESLTYSDILIGGRQLPFPLPDSTGTIVSAVRNGRKILALRSDFGTAAGPVSVRSGGTDLRIEEPGLYRFLL